MKSSEVSIKTRTTPASLTIQGQVTKDTTVKWGAFHSTKTFKNLETAANGTGISWKSFQKFQKLLNFRNANHSTENFRNSASKVEWEENFGCTSRGVYLGVKTCEVFLCLVTIMFVLSIVLTSLFSLFYVTREGDRFLHRE